MILVEDGARAGDVDRVGRLFPPRELDEPIEVRADHAVLGARRRHFREPVELAVGGLADFLGHLRFVDLLAQLVRLGLLRIGLAEFFLDRAQLLAQIELALVLLHLALDVGLDLVAELDDFELLRQEHRQLAHPLLGVALFEDRLPVGGLQAHRRGDEVREEIGIGDVVDFHLHLARRLRQVAQQLREQPGEIAMHRDQIGGFARDVGQLGEGRREIRRDFRERVDAEDGGTRDDAAQRPVGDLEHLLDRADRADAAQIVRARVLVSLSREATRPICFPSRSASSTSAMPGFLTTASGMTVLGNSTASWSGRMPRIS